MKKIKYLYDLKPLKLFTLEQAATRKHSLDILKMPSRMGSVLYYPKESGNG
mgnify:CR=1 FL=1|jgi:hypothetical protein